MSDHPGGRVRPRVGRDPLVIAGLFAGTLAMGVARLRDNLGFFRDEAATAMVVDRSFANMLEVILDREPGMGPYYIGLWVWSRISTGDMWIRSFSVLGSAVAVSLTFMVCRRWARRWTACVAALLFATSWFMYQYQTMARSYTWLPATFLGFVLALDSFRLRPTVRAAGTLGALAGVCVALTPYSAFWILTVIVAAQSFGWIRRPQWRCVAVAGLCALVVALPFVPVLVRRREVVDWIDDVSLRDARIVVQNLFGGTWLLAVFVVGTLCAMVATRRRSSSASLTGALVCGVAFIVPLGMMLLSSELVQPSFIGRYLACSVPVACIAAAIGFSEIFGRLSAAGSGLLLVLPLVLFVQRDPLSDHPRGDDLRAATTFMAEAIAPGDSVLFRPSWARTMLARYWGWHPELDPTMVVDDNLYYPQESLTAEVVTRIEASDRVWVIGYDSPPLRDDVAPRIDLAGRTLVATTVVGGVTFWLYD